MAVSTSKTKSVSLNVSDAIGKVSGEYITPAKPIALITLAHGAGAGMNHAFMIALANALAASGIATLRFNFPFTENKKFRPDPPAIAHQTIDAAINHAHKTYPDLPIFAAGKSFGGRMSSQHIAAHPTEVVKGLIFYGFPLHATGKPSTDRADHLKDIKIPMLFLQGTKDTLATIELIEAVCKSLSKATLVKFEGADHSFKKGKESNIDIIAEKTLSWVKKKIG